MREVLYVLAWLYVGEAWARGADGQANGALVLGFVVGLIVYVVMLALLPLGWRKAAAPAGVFTGLFTAAVLLR